MTTALDSPAARFAGVVADPQTYRNLAYLALAFPFGLLYFTALVTGGVAGLATVPLVVGVPILGAVVATTLAFGYLEAGLTRGLLGADVAFAAPRVRGEPFADYARRVALDPRTYLAFVYLLSKFAIGVVAFTALVTAGALSAGLAAAPLLYDRADVQYDLGAATVDTLPEALAVAPVGVLLALTTLHLCNAGASVLAAYARTMLGSRSARDRAPTR